MRARTAFALVVLAGCAGARPAPPEPHARIFVGTGAVDAGSDAGGEDCHHDMPADELAATATAPFDAIDFQIDDLHGALVITGPMIPGAAFSRTPPITLLRDGTVIRHRYTDDRGTQEVIRGHLSRAEADRFLRDIHELGFERLLSNVDECSCPIPSNGGLLRTCTSDAGTEVIRARGPDGVLRHVAVYANNWNHPEIAASVQAASEHLAPSATPWVPETATLVVKQRWSEPVACKPSLLDASFLPPKDHPLWAAPIRGAALQKAEHALGRSAHQAACIGGNEVVFTLHPWLPGMSFDDAIARWQSRVGSGEVFY